LEAAANALEWIRHRLVNGLEGGTYDGVLDLTHGHSIGNTGRVMTVISNVGATGYNIQARNVLTDSNDTGKGDTITKVNAATVTGQTSNFQNLTVADTTTTKILTLSGDAQMVNCTRWGREIRTGPNAYVQVRRLTANVAQSNTIDPTTFDLLVIP